MFFRRFLNHTAQTIVEICDSLSLAESIKEQIWSSLKYLLSEKTEILVDRHIDQLILCTIYSVCKLHTQVSFKELMEKHSQFFQQEEGLFKNVVLEHGTYGDIIRFYNGVFIPAMKDYLMNKVMSIKPRIEILHPVSPLRAIQPLHTPHMTSPIHSLTKSPSRSPYMTPRTKSLWAPEGQIYNQSRNPVVFNETPSKRLKLYQAALDKPDELSLMPPKLKKE